MTEELFTREAQNKLLSRIVSSIADRLHEEMGMDCELRLGNLIVGFTDSMYARQIVEITTKRHWLGITRKNRRLLLEVYPFNSHFQTTIDVYDPSIIGIVREEMERKASLAGFESNWLPILKQFNPS